MYLPRGVRCTLTGDVLRALAELGSALIESDASPRHGREAMSHPGKPQNTMDLDAVSLQQALRDFEAANSRVLDLTQRLLRSEEQCKQLADLVERLQLRISRTDTTEPLSARRIAQKGAKTVKQIAQQAFSLLRRD